MLGILPALCVAQAASAQVAAPPVECLIRLDDAARHEARITVTYRGLPPGPARFQMARSSPGRYAVHEFAKNVYVVSAADGAGRPLPVEHPDPYGWNVPRHEGTVAVTYTLYGDRGDGTYAQIDASHAHLNMPATFLWAAGQDARPIRVRIAGADPRWKVATQLKAEADGSWSAPSLQLLMDSPVEVSDHVVRRWFLPRGGGEMRLALHHLGSPADADRFAELARKVTAEHLRMWGAAPRFDGGSYTFLADYLPWVAGDGMEHRNSTVLTDTRQLAAAEFDQIQTLSHEFFHAWNVERLRPAELEPFDLTRANPTPSLWFAEGFTSYYGPLAVRRAGIMPVAAYVQSLSGALNSVLNAPARAHGGPQAMSVRAAFTDAARSIDPTNPHVFLSYYTYGQIVALTLDLTLRTRFPGKTLDDYMRLLWRRFGATERPYTSDDLRGALADLTGDRAFADIFFTETIAGSSLPDLAPLLARAGLVLQRAAPQRGWIGAGKVIVSDGRLTLAEPPPPGSPLHGAAVGAGDALVTLGDVALTGEADWQRALAALAPGQSATLVFEQRGTARRATLTALPDPGSELVLAEAAGGALSPAQRRFRAAWLGAR